MSRSQETFNKKEVRNKKQKKKREKAEKREAKRDRKTSGKLDDMMAYIDENGNISDTPPDPSKKKEFKAEDIDIENPGRTVEELSPIRKGTVTQFYPAKGYGFIKDMETKESLFVHIKNVEADELKQNNVVNFEVEMGDKGPIAVNVVLFK